MNTVLLPLRRSRSPVIALSLLVSALLAAASLAGLLFSAALYPTAELRRSFLANDVVDLLIGLPILIGSLIAARRGRLWGLLLWPGALFYVTYTYIAYAVAVVPSIQSAFYLALVALSAYAVSRLLAGLDAPVIRERLAGAVPARLAGGVLAGLGGLFFLRAVAQVAGALSGRQVLTRPEAGVLVADLLIMPFWVAGGVLLWRRLAAGYASAAGLLCQASLLFVGLLVVFILQPVLTTTPFSAADFAVIAPLGLACIVPFGLFIRGARGKGV